MMKTKTTTSITIDLDIYIKSKQKTDFNLSGTVNEYLKTILMNKEEDMKILEKEVEQAKNKATILEHDYKQKMIAASEQAAKELSKEQKESEAELDAVPIGMSFQAKLEREKLFKEKPELKAKWEER